MNAITDSEGLVFPTGVGMNRLPRDEAMLIAGVPHGRGDEPEHLAEHGGECECSPRAWG